MTELKPPIEFENQPDRTAEAMAHVAVGQVINLHMPETPLSPEVLERFENMLNRRQALRAKDSGDLTVFLSHAIAKKLYSCPCCHGHIQIGAEHVIVSRVQMARAYSHHHLDADYTQRLILPRLTDIEIIKPHEASALEVNKRGRRYRNRRRP